MSERASNPEMTISLNPNVRESPLKIEPTEAKTAGEEGTENAATAEQKNASETNKIADTPKPTHGAQDDGKREIEAAALREWDFSNRKVILQNIFKYDDTRTLKKTSLKWIKQMKVLFNVDVEFDRIKKAPKESWTVLTLASESMVQPFIDFINNTDVTNKKGAKIYAKRADADGQVREGARCKREVGSDNVEDQSSSKRQRVEDKTKEARRPVSDDEIRDKVVPLWRLPYDKQVDTKMKEMIKKCAMKIVAETKSRFRDLSRNENRNNVQVYKWLTKQRCIELSDMITAPSKIRNKNEFTFGYRYLFGTNGGCSDEISEADFTKVPSVGFMVTGWAGGVSRPHCCENIPREACMVVDIVDDFLQTSPLPPYDSKFHKGFWRTLTIRTSRRTKECMVIIVHSPASGGVGDADGYAEHFEKEKERLVALLKGAELQTEVAELQPLKVTSIFYQEFEGLSNPKPDHPVQHVYGKQFLHERLGKCIFQISPGAFFQVNTEGAEILYQLVVDQIREVSQNPKDTTLLDVCCGTGTIGLTCVTEGVVAEVVGVDISEPAINDARKNAELNGCGQYDKDTGGLIHFVAGRAEQIMTSVISDAKQSGKKLVAVVDPARDGLHADVVRALRANERIKRIVYVSCNPTGTLVRDAALFCAPPTKRYNGSAFRVVAASPVDMFPGTAHTEVVMTFDRLSDKDAYGQ